MSDYASIRAVNWSSLKHIATSPLLYRHRVDHPRPSTQALTLGTAIHCLVLEPAQFDARFAVFEGTRRGMVWDDWQNAHPGVQSLKPDEMARVKKVAQSIRSHRVASEVLAPCRVEESTTWTDRETGVACKGRLDGIAPHYVADLKGARDVVPRVFERASASLLYHGQLAWYHDGATTAGKIEGDVLPFVIAAQNDEPFDVVVFQLSVETMAAGRSLYRSLLQRLIECEAANYWPGCAPEMQLLGIPPWLEGQTVLSSEDF